MTIETPELSLIVRPDLGARLDHVFDKQTGQDWLWHPPGYDATQTRSLSIGACFDDHWTGGWDEIFPNDAAGEFQGRQLVDHGELWSQEWDVLEQSQLQIKLGLTCKTVPIRVEKTIQLDSVKPEFQIEYTFENLSDELVSFLFKQHAAIAIEPGDEILLPNCSIEPVVLEFSRIIGRAGKTRFPKALDANGEEVALNQTPARSSQLQEFYYCSDLARGQCGIRKSGSALMMDFDLNDFPYVWMFQSYGGWRDYYMLVMEPCTTMPYDLEIASQQGTIATLQPQQKQHRQLIVHLERD
jgi:hypothetical protein